MISAAKVVPVLLSATILSGCMCMMPMGNMDKGKKDDMAGMEMGQKRSTHQMAEKSSGDITITFSMVPESPKTGENLLRVKLMEGMSGHSIENAEVVFRFTMMMPGMMVQEAKARHRQEGFYEARANLSMAGQWDVIVEVTQPGQPTRRESFTVIVS